MTNGIECTTPPDPLLNESTYAAGICKNYAVDAYGNACTPGNAGCYSNWFLPAGDNSQLNCLFNNRVAIGGFALDSYWSSTEYSDVPQDFAWGQFFLDGDQYGGGKGDALRVRCVRAFTP